ncbi:hypothetical protein [Gemmiger sp.]
MKKLLPFLLLLTLSACASAPAETTPLATPTPEPTAAATPAPTSPVSNLMPIPACWNTGSDLYELRWVGAVSGTDAGILLQTDYDTLTQAPYCTVPDCVHDSDACPAYLSDWSCMGVMAVDGTVYVYPTELHTGSNKTIYRVDPAGGRTAVTDAPDELPDDLLFAWCDETSFYGTPYPAAHKPNTLYRWDWQNNTVQSVPLTADETIAAYDGTRFLTARVVTDGQWPAFGNREQEDAVYNSARREYDWLDPADGTREKIFDRPYADGSFTAYYDGKIYYTGNFRNVYTDDQECSLLYYDTANDTEKTLLETLPLNSYATNLSAAFVTAFADAQPRYIRAIGGSVPFDEYLMDIETGELYPTPKITVEGVTRPAVLAAVTADGRWVTMSTPRDSEDPAYDVYALWNADDYLAGGQPTAVGTGWPDASSSA